MQLIVNETNKHEQQESLKTSGPLTFSSRIRKWQIFVVDEMYVVLAMFKLKGTLQKQHLGHTIQRTTCYSLLSFWKISH